MAIPDLRQEGKLELLSITSELMPQGDPNLVGVIKYPTLERLRQEIGTNGVLMIILTLVKDLCSSLNVVRNMNEDQMIETASMLLDERGNFRLEDYVMMFAMAKRGQLVKIFDRVDIDLVGEMVTEYWFRRNSAGRRKQDDEYNHYEDKLKMIERAPGKNISDDMDIPAEEITPAGKEAMNVIKVLTDKLAGGDPVVKAEEERQRKERIKEQQEFYKRAMTPDQIRAMEERRREIDRASSLYDQEQKQKTNPKRTA